MMNKILSLIEAGTLQQEEFFVYLNDYLDLRDMSEDFDEFIISIVESRDGELSVEDYESLLEMIDESVDPEVIRSWTEDQKTEVHEWIQAILSRSDTLVPIEKPEVLK